MYVAYLFVYSSASFLPFHPTITVFKYPTSNVYDYDYTRPFAGIGPTISSHTLWLIHMMRRGACSRFPRHIGPVSVNLNLDEDLVFILSLLIPLVICNLSSLGRLGCVQLLSS